MAAAIALLLAVVLAGGAWLMRGEIALGLMARAYDRAMGSDPTRAGPCTVIVAGRQLFVIDSSQGSTKNLSLMNLPPAQVSAVFLTHYHSDHIADLGELMLQHWAAGAATTPLPIYGPTGADQVVAGFEAAYALDRGYRTVHHGAKIIPPAGFGAAPHAFSVDANSPDVLLIEQTDLRVYAFPVDHAPVGPAVGYLFIYKGRRVVISGDTAPSARVETAAAGADVLVHEGLAPNLAAVQREAALRHGRANLASIFHDILSYHTTPEQAAGIAERAHVRLLLFTHVIPPLPLAALEGPFLGSARNIFHGRLRVGRDGDFITLPAGSREVLETNRLRFFL